jgi:hypothetical protein
MIGAGAVKHYDRFEFRAVGIDKSAHAAKIALSFLAYVTDEKNGPLRFEVSELRRARHRQERRNTAAVIGDSGRGHAASLAANFHVSGRRKNSIEMRSNNDDFLFIRAAQLRDDVSSLVDLHGKPRFAKQVFECRGALRFLKRWSWNLRDAHLLVVDPGNVWGKPIKSLADACIVWKARTLSLA